MKLMLLKFREFAFIHHFSPYKTKCPLNQKKKKKKPPQKQKTKQVY